MLAVKYLVSECRTARPGRTMRGSKHGIIPKLNNNNIMPYLREKSWDFKLSNKIYFKYLPPLPGYHKIKIRNFSVIDSFVYISATIIP